MTTIVPSVLQYKFPISHVICIRYWLCAATGPTIKIWDLESKNMVEELKPEVTSFALFSIYQRRVVLAGFSYHFWYKAVWFFFLFLCFYVFLLLLNVCKYAFVTKNKVFIKQLFIKRNLSCFYSLFSMWFAGAWVQPCWPASVPVHGLERWRSDPVRRIQRQPYPCLAGKQTLSSVVKLVLILLYSRNSVPYLTIN